MAVTDLWVRVKADAADDPRFLQAGPIAGWLWFAGLGWSRRKLTDGRIPKLILASLVPGLKRPQQYAARLVSAELWFDRGEAFEIRDFLQWNPSRQQVKGRLAKDADRKRRERLSESVSEACPSGQGADASRGRAQAALSLSQDSGDLADGEDLDPDNPQPAWRSRPRGHSTDAIAAPVHRRCDPSAASACARGVCVPGFLVAQWRQQLDPERSDGIGVNTAISAFVASEIRQLPPGAVGDDPLAFWRAAWKARHGSQAPVSERPVSTKGSRTAAAFDDAAEALERVHARREP